ncbi:uncharacterized protein [Dendropsophus ebraccatus]|uniref:uncharacterized protein n=1 Tax=Dendropsophus ebraccatus TaxID=150705 RepID=UPI0038321010
MKEYFTKVMMESEKSGTSPSKRKPIPYEDSLCFLISTKSVHSSGNYGCQGSQQKRTTTHAPPETREDTDEESGPSWMGMDIPENPSPLSPTTSSPTTTTTAAGASQPFSSIATSTTTDSTPTCSPRRVPLLGRRTRRTLRTMDRELDVESQALSLIRRIDGKDQFDHFGSLMAFFCRRISPQFVGHYMALCHAMATVFEFAETLPPLEDMIKGISIATGQRPPPRDQSCQTEVQSRFQLPS